MIWYFIATFTPPQVAFYSHYDSLPWHLTNLAIEILFLVDIAGRFRRGFKHDGVRVTDAHFIGLHYLRGNFIGDVVASFPYAWLLGVRIFPDPVGAPPRAAGERLIPLLRGLRIALLPQREVWG